LEAFVIDASTNEAIFEAKWPDRMHCDCGGTLSLVSVDEGYTCSNPDCFLHRTPMDVVLQHRARIEQDV
jgi:hypothetical protein